MSVLVLTKTQLEFLEHAAHWTDLHAKGADELGALAKGASRRTAMTLEKLGLLVLVALGRDFGDESDCPREDIPIYRITPRGREELAREEETGPMCWRVATPAASRCAGKRSAAICSTPRDARGALGSRRARRGRRARRCAKCLQDRASDDKTLPLPNGANEQPHAAGAQGS